MNIGNRCVRVGGAILSVSGPTLSISSGGKTFYFSHHEYLGPMFENKRGEPISSFPPKYSPFWDAHYFWLKQGKRVKGNVCVFESEMQLVDITKQVGRNIFILTGKRKGATNETQ